MGKVIECEAAIDVVTRYFKTINLNPDICVDGLKSLPDAGERPEGRWKWSFADNGWADYTCSVCGYVENVDVHVTINWNFCPNCGARMLRIKKKKG